MNIKYIYRGFCGILLTLLYCASFFMVWYTFVRDHNQTGQLLGYGNLGMSTGIYLVMIFLLMRSLGGYQIGVHRMMRTIAGQIVTLLIADFVEVFISLAITGQFRFFFAFAGRYLGLFIAQSALTLLMSTGMIIMYQRVFPSLKMVEICGNFQNTLYEKIESRPDKYDIEEKIQYPENGEGLEEEIAKYDAVVVNDLPSEEKNKVLKLCFEMDKRVYFTPKLSDIIVRGAEELNIFDTPLYLCRNMGIPLWERILKRAFDIILSAILLVLLSPLFLGVMIAIKIEDGGPVFYKQERVTLNGRKFWILKFRSMIVNAENDGHPHPAGEHDPRITKVGHFIRPCRVDELPQLLNILKGEMSVVGPRPERVEHVEEYIREIPEFSFRHKVRGGLTGYAQVYGKYNTKALDKLKMDLTYITNYSPLLDLQIIFETLKILFVKESTEGFSEKQLEHMRQAELLQQLREEHKG